MPAAAVEEGVERADGLAEKRKVAALGEEAAGEVGAVVASDSLLLSESAGEGRAVGSAVGAEGDSASRDSAARACCRTDCAMSQGLRYGSRKKAPRTCKGERPALDTPCSLAESPEVADAEGAGTPVAPIVDDAVCRSTSGKPATVCPLILMRPGRREAAVAADATDSKREMSRACSNREVTGEEGRRGSVGGSTNEPASSSIGVVKGSPLVGGSVTSVLVVVAEEDEEARGVCGRGRHATCPVTSILLAGTFLCSSCPPCVDLASLAVASSVEGAVALGPSWLSSGMPVRSSIGGTAREIGGGSGL